MSATNRVPNWNDLLPSIDVIEKNLTPDQLEQAGRACDQYIVTLAHGISGIGNLLACTASNGETGLCEEAATDVGWLLEGLGNLISNLADTGEAAKYRRKQLEEIRKGKKKPEAGLQPHQGQSTSDTTNVRTE
jgi:hypothetical protein